MKKILVVVDMQNDFIDGPLGNDECKAVVDNVVNVIESNQYDKVYVTYDTHMDNYLTTQEGINLPVKHCIKGTAGHQYNEKVMNALIDKYEDNFEKIEKLTFGSDVLGQNIKYYIKGDEAEIDFIGVCTGICVISNVLVTKAFNPEARVSVIENACACVTPESHKTAIEAMKLCQVNIK